MTLLKCARCGDTALDTLCPACASMPIALAGLESAALPAETARAPANTIEDAKTATIRRLERERIIDIIINKNICPFASQGPGCREPSLTCQECWFRLLEV